MFCKTKKIYFDRNSSNILSDISIKVELGKTTIITGKNGSGKTTLLRCINYLVQPTSGIITHRYKKPLPMLFQKPFSIHNTVQFNFEILSKIKKIKPSLKWYKEFEIHKISNKLIKDISGGERQKLFICKILSIDSNVIIMDEPNQNLDQNSINKFTNLILEEKKNNKTIICALHNEKIIEKIADKIIILDKGRIMNMI